MPSHRLELFKKKPSVIRFINALPSGPKTKFNSVDFQTLVKCYFILFGRILESLIGLLGLFLLNYITLFNVQRCAGLNKDLMNLTFVV